jgi:hypothetical protein
VQLYVKRHLIAHKEHQFVIFHPIGSSGYCISNFEFQILSLEFRIFILTIPLKSISIMVHYFCNALWYLLKHCPGKVAHDCINVYFWKILLGFRTICFPKMILIFFSKLSKSLSVDNARKHCFPKEFITFS